MLAAVTLCLLTLISTKAARCGEYPHCAACDSETRTCTSCDNGYYGSTCELACNIGCRNGACELTSRGIENCTEGCVAGFRGPNCKVPCAPPPELCQECPRGCQEGYCQLGSSCVSGCKDGYYGVTCKDCSSTCKTCNRLSGTCVECHQSYFGSNCSHPCDRCHVSCKFGCEHGCAPGFHGIFCENNCSEHCQGGSDANGSMVSLPECSQKTGDCIKGCVDGWYGSSCSSQCNPRCRYKRCSPSGDCQHGCVPGYYGTDCSPCPIHCVNNTCDPDTGACQGCDNGLYGLFCNQSLDGICACPVGCDVTGDGCVSTCKNNCTEKGDHTSSATYSIHIGIPTALCIICLVATLCVLHRKRLWRDRQQRAVVDVAPVEYQSQRYWQIRHEDVDPGESGERPEDNLVMPVIAECFPAAVKDSDTSNSSTTVSESYTHLARDPEILAVDPETVVSYLSPAVSESYT